MKGAEEIGRRRRCGKRERVVFGGNREGAGGSGETWGDAREQIGKQNAKCAGVGGRRKGEKGEKGREAESKDEREVGESGGGTGKRKYEKLAGMMSG